MSLSYNQLKPIKVYDPRTNLREHNKYLFKMPGNQVTYETFSSSSNSNSSTSYKVNPPNPSTIVSRLAYQTKKFKVKFDFYEVDGAGAQVALHGADEAESVKNACNFICGITNPNIEIGAAANFPAGANITDRLGANYLFVGGNESICLRQFPLASVCQSQKVTINGDVLTNEPYKFIHEVARFNLDDMARAQSISPAQGDQYQNYYDDKTNIVYTQTIDNANNVEKGKGQGLGIQRSPFSSFGGTGYETPRGSYSPIKIISGGYEGNVTRIECEYEVTEQVFISPLSSGDNNTMGLSMLSTMDMYFSWMSDKLDRMFSVNEGTLCDYANPANGRKPNSINVNISVDFSDSESKMTFCYITNQLNREIPATLTYDYHDWEVHRKDMKAVDAKGKGTQQSDSITLSSIPNKIYFYIKRKDRALSKYTTDATFRITGINIQFNNVSGILSSASEWDLYQMSKDCGYTESYESWRYYGGSVLCLDFGKHLGLPPNNAPGVLGNFGFKFTINYQNISDQSIDPELNFLVDSVGTYTIANNGSIIKNVGVVSVQDTLTAAEEFKEADYDILEKLYGGSFMSGMKNLYSKAASFKPYVKKGSKIAKKLADPIGEFAPRLGNALKTGSDIIDLLIGKGYTKAQAKNMALNYSPKELKKICAGNVVGGNMVAGTLLPKKKLASRAYGY